MYKILFFFRQFHFEKENTEEFVINIKQLKYNFSVWKVSVRLPNVITIIKKNCKV